MMLKESSITVNIQVRDLWNTQCCHCFKFRPVYMQLFPLIVVT